MNGIEFFLTQKVQAATLHQGGWEWHILDNERLHQDIIQILCNVSPAFTQGLFDRPYDECLRQPYRGMFDLLLSLHDGADRLYVEVKCDQGWQPA